MAHLKISEVFPTPGAPTIITLADRGIANPVTDEWCLQEERWYHETCVANLHILENTVHNPEWFLHSTGQATGELLAPCASQNM